MASGPDMVAAATDGRTTIRATLPGGVWVDDALIRHVDLRAIGDADEMQLLEEDVAPPASRATELLERCLVGDDVSARSLTVGDREAVLLQLRRASIGDGVDCILRCTDDSCGEYLELHISTEDILVAPYPVVQQTYSAVFDLDGRCHVIEYRLACGTDLIAAAKTAVADPHRGAAEILRRCVTTVSVDDRAIDVDDLDPRAVARISEDMAAQDPQAEIQLEATCPACGQHFSVLFDTASYLLAELEARAWRLLSEVHLLALHYHWSEKDILAMPAKRRERYLDLIAAELAGVL